MTLMTPGMAPHLAKRVCIGLVLACIAYPAPGAEMQRDAVNAAGQNDRQQ